MTNQVSWAPITTARGGETGWYFKVFRRHRAADAENADAMNVAEIVFDLFQRRRRLEHELGAFAVHLDVERFTGALADDALHIGEVVDGLAVDGDDHVARLESGGRGGTIGLHGVDPRAHGLLAVDHEDPGKNHYSQDEIGNRTRSHDGRALGHRLEKEALGAVARRSWPQGAVPSGTLAAFSSPKNFT